MKASNKPARLSETIITELMIPSFANFGGKIHGGVLLSMMDKVAYACASKHSGAYCVTVAIDHVEFMSPVEVGDLVSMRARVNYVGKSSMVVGIRVEAENVKSNKVRHTNTSYFTMVAKDENDRPTVVPGLLLETKDEVRRFAEAKLRRTLLNEYTQNMKNEKKQFSMSEVLELVKGERCEIIIAD